MKNIDPIKVFRSGAVFFVVGLSLKTWGPFADNNSVGHHVVETLVVMVFVLVFMAFLKQFEKNPGPQPLVELDDETAHYVDALLADGKSVEAVKVVRNATGAGLQLAVATVKAREQNTPSHVAGE